jgi:hypothetical protein
LARLLEGRAHLRQPSGGFALDDPVHPCRAEAPLKCGDGKGVADGCNAIADCGKVGNGFRLIHFPVFVRTKGLRPDSDASPGEAPPIEKFAGVALTVGRDVGMTDDTMCGNRMSGENVTTAAI